MAIGPTGSGDIPSDGVNQQGNGSPKNKAQSSIQERIEALLRNGLNIETKTDPNQSPSKLTESKSVQHLKEKDNTNTTTTNRKTTDIAEKSGIGKGNDSQKTAFLDELKTTSQNKTQKNLPEKTAPSTNPPPIPPKPPGWSLKNAGVAAAKGESEAPKILTPTPEKIEKMNEVRPNPAIKEFKETEKSYQKEMRDLVVKLNTEKQKLKKDEDKKKIDEYEQAIKAFIEEEVEVVTPSQVPGENTDSSFTNLCKNLPKSANALAQKIKGLEDSYVTAVSNMGEINKILSKNNVQYDSLTIMPVQRPPRYVMLLIEILKHTTDQTDKDKIQEALEAAKLLATNVNEAIREREQLTLDFQSLNTYDALKGYIENLGTTGNSLKKVPPKQIDKHLPHILSLIQKKVADKVRSKRTFKIRLTGGTALNRYRKISEKIEDLKKAQDKALTLDDIKDLFSNKSSDESSDESSPAAPSA